ARHRIVRTRRRLLGHQSGSNHCLQLGLCPRRRRFCGGGRSRREERDEHADMRKEAAAHTRLLSARLPSPLTSTTAAVEITPEPSESERQAILAALELERAESRPPSPWRQAGLGPGAEEDEDQAVAPVRQSRGATRA